MSTDKWQVVNNKQIQVLSSLANNLLKCIYVQTSNAEYLYIVAQLTVNSLEEPHIFQVSVNLLHLSDASEIKQTCVYILTLAYA